MLLQMIGISKEFPGVRALDDVDIHVNEGEILGIIGENGAGKSTLIKILSGIYQPDQGVIKIDGEEVVLEKPIDARMKGIRTIFQEFSLIPNLSVMENITMCNVPMMHRVPFFIDRKAMKRETIKSLNLVSADIDPKKPVEDLGVAEAQLVEIAKALYGKAKILIMDEPTAVLGVQESVKLLNTMKLLKDTGVGVIFISHHLDEVLDICDRITVLRDGKRVTTIPSAGAKEDDLIELMVGRQVEEMYPKEKVDIGREVLRVESLSKKKKFEDISFSLYQNEILGIGGLVGSGRTELAKAIIGIEPADEGKIWINGVERIIRSPRDGMKFGLGYLPENRKIEGLVLRLDVAKNISMSSLKKFANIGWINLHKEKEVAQNYVDTLNVHPPDITRETAFLSGGNQQKVVLCKWMSSNSDILIFDEPTRGIDVNAKVEIYQLMNNLVKNGISIIMISSECSELLGITDRILVLSKGRLISEHITSETNEEELVSDYFCTHTKQGLRED